MDNEPFSLSNCTCDFCQEYKTINSSWKSKRPRTYLQKRMKFVVEKIEKKYNTNSKII